MTWKSHALVSGATILALTHSPEYAFLGAITASLPDWMEEFIPTAPHRTWTHILLVWALGAWYGYVHNFAPFYEVIIVSSFLHVLADAFSLNGVPLIFPGLGRLHFGFYRTGKFSEAVTTCAFLVLLLVLFLHTQTFHTNYHYSEYTNKNLFR